MDKSRNMRGFFRNIWWLPAAAAVVGAGLLLAGMGRLPAVSVDLEPPELTGMEPESKPRPLRINFGDSAAKLAEAGKAVTAGVKLAPEIPGRWQWESDRNLVFTPEADWGVGETYKVVLDPGLFRDRLRLAKYQLSFRTAPFSVSNARLEFYIDPKHPGHKRVVATVEFSHPVDPVSLEKHAVFELRSEKGAPLITTKSRVDFTASYSRNCGKAFLQTALLPIPEKSGVMALKLARHVRSGRDGSPLRKAAEYTVKVPGLYDFCRVSSLSLQAVRNSRDELERVLVLKLSAEAAPEKILPHVRAYLLPVDKPEEPGSRGHADHVWRQTSEVSRKVLDLSENVKLIPLPVSRDFDRTFSFKLDVPDGRYVYVLADKHLECLGGYKSPEPFDRILGVKPFPRELKILCDGAILSLSGDHRLSILAHGEEAVKCRVGRVLPEQVQHLVSQTGGRFQDPQFLNWHFGEDNITAGSQQVLELRKTAPGQVQYFSFDFTPHLATGYGLFFFQVEGYDPKRKNVTGSSDKRLILITDLGVLAKGSANGGQDLFVQSIHSGQPAGNVRLEVLGKNGQPLLQRFTDADGHASLPALGAFTREKEPVAVVARLGTDFSFLPFRRPDRRLNFSRFDVGGLFGAGEPEKLRAYIFSDRGIYRPGEEIRAAWMVKAGDWSRKLEGLPMEVAVTDPRELVIFRKPVTLSGTGFEELAYATEATSLTGAYRINVYLTAADRQRTLLGSETVRVEEFVPDRMKISVRFSQDQDQGWVPPQALAALVSLKNLYGIPAPDRRVTAQISLQPGQIALPGYGDYQFFDPFRTKKAFQQSLPDRTTDKNGDAGFDLGLEQFDQATYRLTFLAQGFEPDSGRGVNAVKSILVSPLPYLVGYKANGKLDYIHQGSSRKLSLLALNPEVKPVAVKDVQAQLVEIRYVSVLMQQENGTYKYQSAPKRTPVREWSLSLPAAGLDYDLPSAAPGDYELLLRNREGDELCKVPFTVVGTGNISRSLDKNAELTVRLDQPDYAPGQEIKIFIQAPYHGAGLLTLERDQVYAYQWFKTRTTASVQTLTLPPGLEGNGYVNVAFIRAADSREIYMSPLSYGVAPFSVARDRRINPIHLELPRDTESGKVMQLRYRSDFPGKIVVYAVDEGILQVAGYRTPDPLGFYFQKRALEVNTDQILDQILPEFRLVRELSAAGGGEGAAELGQNLNPFKRKHLQPAAFWSGMKPTDQTWRTLEYSVPSHFNGTLRVMAVAVNQERIGVARQEVLARNHFILTPNLPAFVSPGDEFTASLGVANNLKGSGPNAAVQVGVQPSARVKVLGDSSRDLKIDEGSEQTVTFRFQALPNPGSAEILFTAAGGGKRSVYSAGLSVRPAVPFRVSLQTGVLHSGRTEIKIERKMFAAFRTLEAVASNLPAGLSSGLVKYLQEYPYVCTEQLVSRGFAALFLKLLPELDSEPEKSQNLLNQTRLILSARQNAEGSFGVWAANFHAEPFHAVYALHFLTEAREHGVSAGSEDMLIRGLSYLKEYLHEPKDDLADLRLQAYAGYMLTRNGVMVTNDLQALQERFKDYRGWEQDLAAVYLAAAYKLLAMEGPAERLLGRSGFLQANARRLKYKKREVPAYYDFYTEMTRQAQYLYLVAKHFPEKLPSISGEGVQLLANELQAGRYSTVGSAYTLLALAALSDASGAKQPQVKAVEIRSPNQSVPLEIEPRIFPHIRFSDQSRSLVLTNAGKSPVFYQVVLAGFDRELPQQAENHHLEVFREYRALSGGRSDAVELGREMEVHVRLRALGREYVSNVAVVDLFPGGFEPVLNASRSGERESRAWDEAAQKWRPLGSLDSSWQPEFSDIREDRVVLHGGVGSKAQDFVYRLKAVNQGEFNLPPIYAEAMYDRQIWSQAPGGKIRVTPAPAEK